MHLLVQHIQCVHAGQSQHKMDVTYLPWTIGGISSHSMLHLLSGLSISLEISAKGWIVLEKPQWLLMM